MENVNELLDAVTMAGIDLETIDDELGQLYGRVRYVLADLILELYGHYKKGACYVPHIDDVDPNLRLWCHRRDVERILEWIKGALFDIDYYEKEGRFEDGDETVEEFVLSYIDDDEGIDMVSHFRKIQDAIRCIKHEIEKKCSRED